MNVIQAAASERKFHAEPEPLTLLPESLCSFPVNEHKPGVLLLGRYKVIAKLGQGSKGIVYKCFDEVAGIEVALKAFSPELSCDVRAMENIRQSFQYATKLHHQNIVVSHTLEKDPASGDHYLVMEYVAGEVLADWMKKQTAPLTTDQILVLIRQIAEALDYAHGQNVMHRSINPRNIMICGGMVKVLNFGVAIPLPDSDECSTTDSCMSPRTASYMAPEQLSGNAQDAVADQYSLGVMTYELLAGHHPFEKSDLAAVREAVLNEEPQKIPGIPGHVQSAIKRAMSKAPRNRFRKCTDFVDAMSSGSPNTVSGRLFKWCAVGAVTALILGAAGYGARLFMGLQKEKLRAVEMEEARKGNSGTESEKGDFPEKHYEALRRSCQETIKKVEGAGMQLTGRFESDFKSLKKNCANGCVAREKKLFDIAHKKFKAAEMYRQRVVQTLPLYAAAYTQKKKSLQSRNAADRFKASVLAKTGYTLASASFNQGEKELFSGDFNAAGVSFEKAEIQFKNAQEQAKAVYLKNLLAKAQSAEKNEEWEKLAGIAGKLRPADPVSAVRLSAIAEKGLGVKRQLAAARDAMKSGRLPVALKILSDVLAVNKNNPQAVAWKSDVVKRLNANDAKYKQKCERETAVLLTTLPAVKKSIEATMLDRGQTFGRHMDCLKQDFETGIRLKQSDPVKAYGSLKKAEAAAQWILINTPLREQALELLSTLCDKKEDADSFSASEMSVVHYNRGMEFYLRGDIEYEEGGFEIAVEDFRRAVREYELAYTAAREVYVRQHTAAIQHAMQKQKWQEVAEMVEKLRRANGELAAEFSSIARERQQISNLLSEARELWYLEEFEKALACTLKILEIKKDHAEALDLRRKIEGKLQTGVKFIVTVDGREVDAEILLAGKTPERSGVVIKGIKKNQHYSGSLKYGRFVQKINFLCDWEGVQVKKYALKEADNSRVYVLPKGVKLKMLRINAGSFMMGSPRDEAGHTSMETLHKVTLSDDFWIGQYEVTQEQYNAVTNYRPAWFKGDKHPVESITWFEAKAFCQALNRYCASQLPAGYKFDLPSEAQWEYACRAQTQTPLNSGKELVSLNERCYNLDDIAWYKYNHNIQGHQAVGQKSPNNWKLYDMHGNVAEWCDDGYGFYQSGEVRDPKALGNSRFRVYRGGDWKSDPVHCRSAQRGGIDPRSRSESIGFRVAIVREEKP